jgi:hypothetical protein
MVEWLLFWWLMQEDSKPPVRSHRYVTDPAMIEENRRLNEIQKERDERARREAERNASNNITS